MNDRLTSFFLFLFLTALLSSCAKGRKSVTPTDELPLVYPVLTLTPQTATLQNIYPATIEGQQNIEIRPKIDGYIENIYVDEGATVKKGDPLFKIDAPQYEQEVRTAEAAIKIAEADISTAKMEVHKARTLVEKNIISKFELEAAEYKLASEQALLAQAQANLINAKTNVGYTLITSPVDGVVGTLPYKIGSLVTTNTPMPLTTVSDISNIFAYFSINEKQLLELSKDSEEHLQFILTHMPPVELLLSNNTKFSEKGKVDATSGSINTATGSIRVRATFPNPQNRIRSGSSGTVVIPLRLDSALVVPQKATYEIQGAKFVYLITPENKAVSTPITVMDNSDGHFYVATEGLTAGDQIALEGLPSLHDGVIIEKKLVDPDSLYQKLTPTTRPMK